MYCIYEVCKYHNGWHCWLRQWWPCSFHYPQCLSVEKTIKKFKKIFSSYMIHDILHGQKIVDTWALSTEHVLVAFQCFLLFRLNGFEFIKKKKKNHILLLLILTTYIHAFKIRHVHISYTHKTCSSKLTKQHNIHKHTTSWSIPEYPQGKTYMLRRFSNTLWLSPFSLYHQHIPVKMRISENAQYLRLNAGRWCGEVSKSA